MSISRWLFTLLLCACFLAPHLPGRRKNVCSTTGKIFTGEPDHPYAEAVAIRGDKIVAVGTRGEAARGGGEWRGVDRSQGQIL